MFKRSLLCGAAGSMTQLIVFRGLQGVAAGMITGLLFTIIGDIFAPAERARFSAPLVKRDVAAKMPCCVGKSTSTSSPKKVSMS